MVFAHSLFSSNFAAFIDFSKNHYKLSLKHKQTFNMFHDRDFAVVDYPVKKSDIHAITSILLNVKVVVSFFGTWPIFRLILLFLSYFQKIFIN